MAIEIVDFPINSMVIFHSYVSHYQRVMEKQAESCASMQSHPVGLKDDCC